MSVNDGEEVVIKNSTSIQAVKDVLGSTGEDYLRVTDSEDAHVGTFWMIWDNGDGEPIAD